MSTIPFWDYGGSAVATENFVRLVPAIRSRSGFLWNTEPVTFKSWEVEFEFRIHNTRSPGADGMAFWYAKQPKVQGSLFGNDENFEGLGIFFDTYDNDGQRDNPRVVGVTGPQSNWDFDTDFRNTQFASCQSDFRNTENNVRVKVTYSRQVVQVMLDTTGNGNYVLCFSKDRINLPTGYYFGLTAMTGGLADYHDVMRFTTKDTSLPAAEESEEHQGLGNRRRAGWWDPYEFYRKALELESQQKKETEAKQAEPQEEAPKAKEPEKIDTADVFQKELTDRYNRFTNQAQKEQPPQKQQEQKPKQKKQQRPPKREKPKQQKKPFRKQQEIRRSRSTDNGDRDNSALLVLQSLEAITQHLRSTAQKSDLKSLADQLRAVTNDVASVNGEMMGFKGDLTQELSITKQTTKQELDRVKEALRSLEGKIKSTQDRIEDVYRRLDEHATSVGAVPGAVEQTLLRNQSTMGPWLYFILFQIVFAAGYIAWKRYSDLKYRDKLF